MSGVWHWLVVTLVVVSIAAWFWLLFANSRGKPGETTGHVWDDDLQEYNNPLPRWWFNLFLITLVFGIGYLVFYPGLGSFEGAGGWSQEKQLRERLAEVESRRKAAYAGLAGRDIPALAKDPKVLSLGRELYLANCAGCHGADARGAVGFPNLADDDWLFGGTPEAILASITDGRTGQMPGFGTAIPPETVTALVEWLLRRDDPKLDLHTRGVAEKQYAATCAACHGADGKGNQQLGAPNLTDEVWLFGSDRESIRRTILHGRSAKMPAHDRILSGDDIKIVASYVYSLSEKK